MKISLFMLPFIMIFTSCAVKYDTLHPYHDTSRVILLQNKLQSLSTSVNPREAQDMSVFALNYTKVLANKYEVILSPNFHNFLINIGLKSRGLCYNYADDLSLALKQRAYQSFRLYRVIHKKGTIREHSAVLVRAKDRDDKAVILDGWRNSGILYFSYLKDDSNYNWKIYWQVQ